MRIAIAGAGSVGRSIARELLANGHQVLLIDKNFGKVRPQRIPEADWMQADACELASLEDAGLEDFEVVISATGDDKVNLVVSLLAKTEFSVRRVVARINHPANEWLFNESWGVDVAVSTPRVLAALVEEAVSVGDVVRLFTLREVQLPSDAAMVAIIRGSRVIVPTPDEPLEPGDELLFVALPEAEPAIRRAVCAA
ncbi:MAG TPA: TrkA family potassium uptake protein [Jatrophihabitans sp.]